MSETTILKTSAIVRNATFAPPQHGPVNSGALPLVQVRMAPGGPQVQQGQQKPVEILPPRDAKSAVATGGLPMVAVKMTQNGPQLDDGRDNPVVVRDSKHTGVSAGGLPMVQVRMDGGKPQVQTLPTVKGGPPHVQAAAPALSAPRGGGIRTVAAPARHVIAAPQRQVAVLPTVPDLSTDQLMLCRHLAGKYLAELLEAVKPVEAAPAEGSTETFVESDAILLARATVTMLDEVLIATSVRAAAAEEAAAAPAASTVYSPPTQTFAAAASIAPAPSASYVAGRVGGRPQGGYTGGVRSQRNAGIAPRRVARAGSPLPPVIVKMDGGRPTVQNQAEVQAVREQVLSQPVASEVVDAPQG